MRAPIIVICHHKTANKQTSKQTNKQNSIVLKHRFLTFCMDDTNFGGAYKLLNKNTNYLYVALSLFPAVASAHPKFIYEIRTVRSKY